MEQIFELDVQYISGDKKKFSYIIFKDSQTTNPNLFLKNIIF